MRVLRNGLVTMPETLTEAVAQAGLIVIRRTVNASNLSTAREIPYSEIYRQSTGLIESPVERLQRAADDEARRAQREAHSVR
jgi:hypothetical protein